jgi:hypothetical protein
MNGLSEILIKFLYLLYYKVSNSQTCYKSPLECEFSRLSLTTSSSVFPAPESLPFLLFKNDELAEQYFGMNGSTTYGAIRRNMLSLNAVAAALDKRLLSVYVYYQDLSYTQIEQEPKMEVCFRVKQKK